MGKVTHLMGHCSATPEGMAVTPGMIEEWHRGPRELADGTIRFNGANYFRREELPNIYINDKHIADISGRGWRQVGYSDFIDLDGVTHILNEHDWDGEIQGWELTNGAFGWNNNAFHFCYAGGTDSHGNPKDTRTPEQLDAMSSLVRLYIDKLEEIKLIGHNQVSKKACPSFDMRTWATELGIDSLNIDFNEYR